MQTNNMQPRNNITINKILLSETGTYNDIGPRSFRANVDLDSIATMQEVTQDGSFITASTIAGVAGGILRPSAEMEGVATIANGWGQSRYRFMMEVAVRQGPGAVTLHILSGYTDHNEGIGSRSIDPNMRLYINGGVKVSQSTAMTPTGNQVYSRPIESYQLLTGSYAPTFGQNDNTTQALRPEDVFCSMSKSMLGGGQVNDYRTGFALGAKKSRRSNNLAPSHLAATLKAHFTATSASDDTVSDYPAIMEDARGTVREETVSGDTFLAMLHRNTGFKTESFITYGELLNLDPDLHHRVVVSHLGTTHRSEVHRTGQSEYWTTSTQETMMATIITQSVPSMMMELLLPKVSWWATNQTMDGSIDIRILAHAGFSDAVDMTPQIQRFIERLRNELLRDISRNNQVGFTLKVAADIMGDISTSVSLNGYPFVDYNTAVFCDALYSPMITNQAGGLDRMAHAVNDLAESIGVRYNDNNNQGVIVNAAGSSI